MINMEDLRIEFKLMGINAIIPVIIMLIPLIIGISSSTSGLNDVNTFLATEMFLPIASGWITIMAFNDILKRNCSEVIFTYKISRFKLGIGRLLIFFQYYFIITLVESLILCNIFNVCSFLQFFVHMILSGLFVSSLSFCIMCFTGNTEISLSVMIAYIVTTMLIGYNNIPVFSILKFNGFDMGIGDIVYWSIKCIIISMILLVLGQVKFNRFTK